MRKLSIKLGILFYVIIFGFITFMFYFLHQGIVESTVEEEINSLQARGNSHRAILEKHFDKETINHVILMESESDTDVVITDESGKIFDSSTKTNSLKKYLQKPELDVPWEGQTVEDNWDEEPYIATVSPVYSDKQPIGFVYMFQDTASIHTLIQRLNNHFLLAGGISVILTFIIIVFLSKGITKPLIKMKEATFQISRGNFSVSLPKMANDELGDLANSIELLASDLNYLKEERSQFLASISHELRTPLTYIKGYADILYKRDLSNDEKAKYLQIIVEETNRMSNLIKELFDLAKIDQNLFVIQPEEIDLYPFLLKIKQKLYPAFLEKKINFELDCQPNLTLTADPLKLEQIILNLLDNAKKYSPKGSKVILKGWKTGKLIHLSVEDNGKGIPQKDLPYIFNRLFRVDKSRNSSLGGTGLGLAIVKELVNAHRAKITVRSKENFGTEFEIIFREESR